MCMQGRVKWELLSRATTRKQRAGLIPDTTKDDVFMTQERLQVVKI